MENKTTPLITIGIPTYNRSKKIPRTVASIFEQNYVNIEVVISDNCSSDDTQEVCSGLMQAYPNIRYFRQKNNIGMIPNFQFIIQQASGKYFMLVADDDTLEPNILNRYANFLEEHAEYSLVSGEIKYWSGDKLLYHEKGFNFEQTWPSLRVIAFYFKVVHGGIFAGLMRLRFAKEVPLRKVIGNDWHFLAGLAFLGKVKNLEFTGYHKKVGGTSVNFKQYAMSLGESNFAANYPHIKMAKDAYHEIMSNAKIYAILPSTGKFFLAAASFLSIVSCYYFKIFPFVIGGKVKRLIMNSLRLSFK